MAEENKILEVKEQQENKAEVKTEDKTEVQSKKPEQKKVKRNEAAVRATLKISKKHSMAICRMINNKTVDNALKELQEVTAKRKAVKMTGELPHRKGMMSGRYPVKASLSFIKLLKNLNSNASQLGVNTILAKIFAKADGAGSSRSGRFKGKNTHLSILIREGKRNENKETRK